MIIQVDGKPRHGLRRGAAQAAGMNEPHPFPHPAGPRPASVIWFTVDQMRGQALSIAGDPQVRTPNLDRMARDGVWFRNALSGFPLCCPARGSWLTGLYPHRCVAGHERPMPVGLPTVADAFNAAGYHTAWLGKWHLDGHRERDLRDAWHHVPRERRGRFATWLGYDNNNSQYDCWIHGHDGAEGVPIRRLPGHESEALTDLLIGQIERHAGRPFFLAASLQPPHDPYTAPAEWAVRHQPAGIALRANVPPVAEVVEQARRDLAGYYALIEHIDAQVGRVMAALERLGLADTTYLVFTSDHGDQHGSHGHFRKMTPYEESIRVPMLIWGGRRWQYRARGTVDWCFNHVDLAPTSLGLAGIAPPAGMQGFDYSAVMRGSLGEGAPASGPELATAPDSAYLQCVEPTGHGPSADVPWRGIVTRDGWKYVVIPGQPWMLFDLNRDPHELINLAHHSHARGKRAALQQRLATWIERTSDAFHLPELGPDGRLVAAHAAPG